MSETAVFLYSSLATDQIQIVNTRRLEDVLNGNKLVFLKVDGSQAGEKEIRDQLFSVSGHRGKYPQCFIKGEDGSFRFVGLWEEVESLVDCDALPADILAANPNISTFKKVSNPHPYPCLIIFLNAYTVSFWSGFRQCGQNSVKWR
eukprot:gene503-542_t